MTMEGFQPVFDVNGGNGGWGGASIGAFGGALVGSLLFGNGRWGGGNCGGGSCGDPYIADQLSSLNTNVNAIGRDNLLQSGSIGRDLAVGQSRTEAAVYSTSLQGQIGQKDNLIATLGAAHAAEVQGMRNTFDIVSSQKDCCCATQRLIEECCCKTQQAIHAEGEATRAQNAQLDKERILREMCAKDAMIAELKSNQFNAGLASNTQHQFQHAIRELERDLRHYIRYHSGEEATTTAAG